MIPGLPYTFALFALPGSYGLWQWACARQRHHHLTLRAWQDILRLRPLLEKVPQHRGMANAFLQGDDTFRTRLSELQHAITSEIGALHDLEEGGDPWEIRDQILRAERKWSELVSRLEKLSAQESFTLHTALIRQLAQLMEEIAIAADLEDDEAIPPAQRCAVIQIIPQVTETLGQARGMATGVAAKGHCGADMQVKLTHLAANGERAMEALETSLPPSLEALPAASRQHAQTALSHSLEATRSFLQLLQRELITQRTVTLPSSEVYQAGTEAIRLCFELFDLLGETVATHLRQRAVQIRHRTLWWRLLASGTGGSALFLSALSLG